MPFVVGLVLLAIFWVVAPKFFRWFFILNLATSVGGYVVLRILGFALGATKGGRNAGMFEEEGLLLGLSFFGMPAIVLLGLVSAAILAIARRKPQPSQASMTSEQ